LNLGTRSFSGIPPTSVLSRMPNQTSSIVETRTRIRVCAAPTWRGGFGSKAFLIRTRLVFIDETVVTINMVRLRDRCPRGERLIGRVPQGAWKTRYA
jgi:hypothetical protein